MNVIFVILRKMQCSRKKQAYAIFQVQSNDKTKENASKSNRFD